MIGLGKMGANMTERLLKGGHEVVAFDLSADALRQAASKGAETASSLAELAEKLTAPKAAWVMLPAGKVTDSTVEQLAGLFSRRRCDRRRRQFGLQGIPSVGGRDRAERDRHGRRRDVRRCVGPHRGLLPDGGGHQRVRGGRRARAATLGARGRLRPRRAYRRGPFRQDGPQRDRVRADAGVRRRLRDHERGRTSSTSTCTRLRRSGATGR